MTNQEFLDRLEVLSPDTKFVICSRCSRLAVERDGYERLRMYRYLTCPETGATLHAPEITVFVGHDRFGRAYCYECWEVRMDKLAAGYRGFLGLPVPLPTIARPARKGRWPDEDDPGFDDVVRAYEDRP